MFRKQNRICYLSLACFFGLALLLTGCEGISENHLPTGPSTTPGEEVNLAPVINCINCTATKVKPNAVIKVYVDAYDPNDDELTYTFYTQNGTIDAVGNVATWKLPSDGGEYKIQVSVSDGEESTSQEAQVEVTNIKGTPW